MTNGAIIPIDGHREFPAAAHCERCKTSRALRMVANGVFVCSNPAQCAWNIKRKQKMAKAGTTGRRR